MSTEITIAHLSDIHVGPTTEPVRDINVRQNFDITLADIANESPDLIILGGDQAARTGEIEVYQWIKPRLDRIGIPYLMVPGNHDNIDNMVRVFGLEKELQGERLYFSKQINGLKLIFLDSSLERVDGQQLLWLEKEAGDLDSPALLFMHHPPVFCNCSFMDRKYPLHDRETVFALLKELSAIENIFCGHYHTDKIIRESGMNIYLTPSTMLQMDQKNPDYTVSGTAPGWRFIRWNGLRLETYVRYLQPK